MVLAARYGSEDDKAVSISNLCLQMVERFHSLPIDKENNLRSQVLTMEQSFQNPFPPLLGPMIEESPELNGVFLGNFDFVSFSKNVVENIR